MINTFCRNSLNYDAHQTRECADSVIVGIYGAQEFGGDGAWCVGSVGGRAAAVLRPG